MEAVEYSSDDLVGLSYAQAQAMADIFNNLLIRLAEAEFLVSLYDRGEKIPFDGHVSSEDFVIVSD